MTQSGHLGIAPKGNVALQILRSQSKLGRYFQEERRLKMSCRISLRPASRRLLAGCALLAFTGSTSYPQQINGTPEINGTPGSPSATTTIPGSQLPAPDPKFGGVIEETAKDSKPY